MKKYFLTTILSALVLMLHAQQQTNVADSVNVAPAAKPDTAVKQTPPPPPAPQAAAAEAPAKQNTVKKDTRSFKQKWSFNLSSSFWSNSSYSYADISPTLTYHFPKTYSVGGGPIYVYSRNKDYNENMNGFGGRIFVNAYLTKWFYAWTEYQGISNQYIEVNETTNNYERQQGYVDSWFVSLGIRIGRLNAQALYDVLYDKTRSPYGSAWTYRIGFGF